MHILHHDNFFSFLLGVAIDEEVLFVSPPVDDYFPDVAVTSSDPLNNGTCIGNGCRWEEVHILKVEFVWGVGESEGQTVVE